MRFQPKKASVKCGWMSEDFSWKEPVNKKGLADHLHLP